MRKRLSTRTLAPTLAIAFLLTVQAALGQTDSLSLSSGVVAANGTVPLNLNLASPAGSQPASIQWTLTYPAASVVSIAASLGPAGSGSAAKTIGCVPGAGSYTCLIYGINAAVIPNGTVAIVNLTMAAGATSASIGITKASAASAAGNAIAVSASGVTATRGITSLTAARLVSSLACNPVSLASRAGSSCTVALSGAAPTGGAIVSLSSSNALLPVAASVTVPAAASSATFTATAGAIPSDQSATLTATLGGVSQTTPVHLVAPVLVSAVSCPPTLGPSISGTCTITLTKNALPGGAGVSLSSSSALLPVPASVTVAAGSNTASFRVVAGAFKANQSSLVSASYNGSTHAFTVSLVVAPLGVSSLVCPAGLLSRAIGACVVTLSKPPATNTNVSLSSSSPLIIVPATAMVFAGTTTGQFIATIGTVTAATSGTITATLNATAHTATLTLGTAPAITSLVCSPTQLSVGGSGVCTVTLSKSAGAVLVGVSTSLPGALTVPATAMVGSGNSVISFPITARAAGSLLRVVAELNGVSKSVPLTVSAPKAAASSSSHASLSHLRSLSCAPRAIAGGSHATCRVSLEGVTDSSTAELQLTTSNPTLQVPAMVTTRPGQSSVAFQLDSAAVSGTDGAAAVTVQLGSDSVQEKLTLSPRQHGSTPGVSISGRQLVKYGTAVHFSVSRSDPSDRLFAEALPAGASFEPITGIFDWTPTALQEGSYDLAFTALPSTGVLATVHVALDVDSGSPVIDRVVNAASHSQEAACSPGAIARAEGRWLAGDSPSADPSGNSLQLSGTTLKVNGITAPILYVSSTRVDFLCPNSVPGNAHQIVVETPNAATQPVYATARDLAPGIFSVDGSGSGQGLAFHAGGSRLAMVRNHQYASQPAQPGDSMVVYATGIDGSASVSVNVGGIQVAADSVSPVSGLSGLTQLSFTVPQAATPGDLVTLSVAARSPYGSATDFNHSNQVYIAIEESTRRQ
jgi:uncharacterized protein (TIGR03437 family)